MTATFLLIEGINPEPWTAPELSVGRRAGKPFPIASKKPTLRVFQEALADEVHEMLPVDWKPVEEDIELEVFFWRRLESYESDSGRMVTRHRADRSNLLKATEDALQHDPKAKPPRRSLFKNDKQILAGNTMILGQSKDTEPMIFIVMRPIDVVRELEVNEAIDVVVEQMLSRGEMFYEEDGEMLV